jgi:hypothetical protein
MDTLLFPRFRLVEAARLCARRFEERSGGRTLATASAAFTLMKRSVSSHAVAPCTP